MWSFFLSHADIFTINSFPILLFISIFYFSLHLLYKMANKIIATATQVQGQINDRAQSICEAILKGTLVPNAVYLNNKEELDSLDNLAEGQ